MSSRRRKRGLAASVAAAKPTPPTSVQAALQAVPQRPQYRATYADGRLWDRDGRPWDLADESVGPDRALGLVRSGTPWLIDWCGGPLEWPTADNATRLLDTVVVPHLKRGENAHRVGRRGTLRTAIVAEEWRDERGNSLIVFNEG